MPPVLYRRQRQILDFINQYVEKFGYSPTLGEIREALGVSSLSTICEHLDTLEKKKMIRRYKGAVRGIEVLENDVSLGLEKGIEVPILGFIAAGEPIEPHTDPNASVLVPQQMVSGKKRSFVLQVKGESMIEEGILPDDYIIVEERSDAQDGDVVVAILENGFATLKKFFREKDRFRLEPANSQMKPIFAKKLTIQGKAIGIIRNFS
ncbi:MAG: transcriptional repressor LexA [Candidatus Shapirobacteria bacterium]